MKHFRIGILGGMGPLAGIRLQELIVEATKSARDQDHLEVVSFTLPQIPDRTESLTRDGGASYVAGVQEGVRMLERAGATVIVIACNTAHARLEEIQTATTVPIVNMVALVADHINSDSNVSSVGILATDGARRSEVFDRVLKKRITWPTTEHQALIMKAIYEIKAGRASAKINQWIDDAAYEFHRCGITSVILGCTELSLYSKELRAAHARHLDIIDPLEIVSKHLVELTHRA